MDPPAHNSTKITRDWQVQRWSFYWACKAPDNFHILLNYECLRFAKPSEKSHRWNLKDGIFTCHFIYALGYLLLSNHTRLWILLRFLSADTFSWFKEYKMKTWFMISIKFIPGSIIGSINYSFIHLFITYKLRARSGPEEHCAGGKHYKQKENGGSTSLMNFLIWGRKF